MHKHGVRKYLPTHEYDLDTLMLSLVFVQSLEAVRCCCVFLLGTLHMIYEDLCPDDERTVLQLHHEDIPSY